MTSIGISSLSGESSVLVNLQTSLSMRKTFPGAELCPIEIAGWKWGICVIRGKV